MQWKTGFLVLVIAALVPVPAAADVITPLSYVTVPLLPVIIIVEALVFLLLSRKWLHVPVGFWKVLGVMAVANLVTSLLGTFVPIYRYAGENVFWIGVAFVLSVVVEWGVYIALFRELRTRRWGALILSVGANLATYVPFAVLFGLAGSTPPGPPVP